MSELETQKASVRLGVKDKGLVIQRFGALIAFFVACVVFTLASPAFARPSNLLNILDHSVLLLIVSLAMTTVIVAGGIDLSVGIALDFGAMVAVSLLQARVVWPLVIPAGLLAGLLLGLINAFLIVRVGISPFLATLSISFIGQSVQRIYTHGGEPIYMMNMPRGYLFLARGKLLGIPFHVIIAAAILLVFYLFIERTAVGMRLRAVGLQYGAARVSGLRVRSYSALAYIVSALTCAAAGILHSSSLNSYVPISGEYYLLDSIGATFIGTTIDPEARPNVPGTVFGVLFFGVVTNGLNLLGLSFYWKIVAKGVLIFVALVLGSLNQRRSS